MDVVVHLLWWLWCGDPGRLWPLDSALWADPLLLTLQLARTKVAVQSGEDAARVSGVLGDI
jgi:hypothetical protein